MLASLCCLLFSFALAEELAGFDRAVATSTYASNSGAFAASRALGLGAGYWCSSGGHGTEQAVSFTGITNVARRVQGIAVQWAYSPAEMQVLVSADGVNFAEAVSWRAATQEEAAYVEHFMFEHTLPMRAVTIVMRGARSWRYFGVSSVASIAEPAPVMLVSAATRRSEACVAESGGSLVLASCVDTVAAGLGNDMFRFRESGLLESVVRPGQCVAVSNDPMDEGSVGIAPCVQLLEAGDGRGMISLSRAGQLRVRSGATCLVAQGEGLVAEGCEAAARMPDGSDRFYTVAVTAPDGVADGARMSAELALKSAARLAGQTSELKHALDSFPGCALSEDQLAAPAAHWGLSASQALGASSPSVERDDATSLAALVLQGLGIADLPRVLADARQVIDSAASAL